MIIDDENIWKINKKSYIVVHKHQNVNYNRFFGLGIQNYLAIIKMGNFYNYSLKLQIAKKYN